MVHRIKLSREHESAWKQTAKTEVTPLPQKTEQGTKLCSPSGRAEGQEEVEVIRCGKTGRWKAKGKRELTRRCEVVKGQGQRFRPAANSVFFYLSHQLPDTIHK